MSEFRSAHAASDRDGERLHAETLKVLERWGAPRDPETGALRYSEAAYMKATATVEADAVKADALQETLYEYGLVALEPAATVTNEDLTERAQRILDEAGNDDPSADDWKAALSQAIGEMGRPGEPRRDQSVASSQVRDRLLDKAEERGAIRARDRGHWEERWTDDPAGTAKIVAGLEPDPTFAAFARRGEDGRVVEAPDHESLLLHEAAERLLTLAGFTKKSPYGEQDYAGVLVALGDCDPAWRDTLELEVSSREPFGIDNLVRALRTQANVIAQAVRAGAEPPAAAITSATDSGADLDFDSVVSIHELPPGIVRRARSSLAARGVNDPSDAEVVKAALRIAEARLGAT